MANIIMRVNKRNAGPTVIYGSLLVRRPNNRGRSAQGEAVKEKIIASFIGLDPVCP